MSGFTIKIISYAKMSFLKFFLYSVGTSNKKIKIALFSDISKLYFFKQIIVHGVYVVEMIVPSSGSLSMAVKA